MSDEQRGRLDETTFFWGTLLGFVLGAIAWFFRVPRRGEETREQIAETGRDLVARDSVNDSLEEGRALARQRMESNQG
jgi:gas vesicle protein